MEVIIEGIVTQGRQLGRELGFPTANIELAACVELPDGVYLSRVELMANGVTYNAVSNLGSNPTVGGAKRRLESHLLDYQGPVLYGERLRILLLEQLRAERRFDTLEELRRQIAADVCEACRRFAPFTDSHAAQTE